MRLPAPRLARRLAAAALGAALTALLCAALGATEPASDPPQRHLQWLEEVDLLLHDYERAAFGALRDDYERERFIRRFWQVRDPDPTTQINEFRQTWEERVATARSRFGSLTDDRARALLVLGPLERAQPLLCLKALYPLEVWSYPGGFHLVFVNAPESGPEGMRLWSPGEGLRPLLNSRVDPGIEPAAAIQSACVNGDEILSWLGSASDLGRLVEELDLVPDPGEEWTLAFAGRVTELPPGAETFPATLSLRYPARRGQRTVVQGLVKLARQDVVAETRRGQSTFRFLLDGRILRDDSLFEDFRYRFEIPGGDLEGDEIALAVERLLRPGSYRMVVKLEDLNGERFFLRDLDLEVPRVEPRPARLSPEGAAVSLPSDASGVAEAEALDLLEEANRTLARGGHRVRLRAPLAQLQVGVTPFAAEAAGEGIAKVSFLLDDRPVLSKSRPPYAVDLDLGPVPRVHRVAAVALDADDRELARDEITLNAGPHRFAVRLLEPRPGSTFRRSLRVHVDVEVPEGQEVERVELYLNETLLATLYQPPYLHPLLLPRFEEMAYLRAVAYLPDGLFAEDLVFLNAPPGLDRMRIDFVELFTSVANRRGQPVLDLSREEVRVVEKGVPQTIRRFERVTDLPIHAMVAIDASTSMRQRIHAVESAAREFLTRLVEAKDRGSVVVFNDRPQLLVPFTSDQGVLASGLDGLATEGRTALFDTVVFALYNFGGITGKRALVLFSDGADTASEFDSETALEYARHAGVAIYTIALQVKSSDLRSRLHLEHLAAETGGRSFFIDHLSELASVYARIETDLRSQYLIAYQSSAAGSEFRRVKVEIDRPGVQAKTIPGYYP